MGICMNPTRAEEFYGKDPTYIHNHPCIQTLAPNFHNRLAFLRLGCSTLHSPENPSRWSQFSNIELMDNGLREGFGRAGKSSVLTGHFLNNLSSQKFSLRFHRSSDPDPSGSQISRKPGGLILILVLSCSILIPVDSNKSRARSNHQFHV